MSQENVEAFKRGLEIGQIRTTAAGLWHIRGGKVTKVVIYWDRERAFAELGLAPELSE